MTNDNPALDAPLPCPFCGGEKILIYKKFFKIDCPDSEMETHKKVKCDGCGIGTEWYYDTRFGTAEENARNAWNIRPQPCGDAVKALDAFNWLKSMGMISFNDTGFNKGVSVITYSEQLKLVEDFLNGKK